MPIGATELELLENQAERYRAGSRADNTRRAYRGDWRQYTEWCVAIGVEVFPGVEMQVPAYLAYLADEEALASASIQRKLQAVRKFYRDEIGRRNVTMTEAVSRTLEGILRKKGKRQDQKAPLMAKDLRRICKRMKKDVRGQRDKALLLLGIAGGFRRSEIAGLQFEDVAFSDDGMTVLLGSSKTDQFARGEVKSIDPGRYKSTCPVRAVKAWISASGIVDGGLFRGVHRSGLLKATPMCADTVALIVKSAVESIGLDVAAFSGHSLRAGAVTNMLAGGASDAAVMAVTGHRNVQSVARYNRPELFGGQSTKRMGL